MGVPETESELYLLKVGSDRHIPFELLGHLQPERFSSLGLSMDQKRLAGRLGEFVQPAQNLPVICMATQVF